MNKVIDRDIDTGFGTKYAKFLMRLSLIIEYRFSGDHTMKVINGAIRSFNKKRSGMFSSKKSLMLKSKASSIYRELIEEGCHPNDIISLSTHLISFVTTDLKAKK